MAEVGRVTLGDRLNNLGPGPLLISLMLFLAGVWGASWYFKPPVEQAPAAYTGYAAQPEGVVGPIVAVAGLNADQVELGRRLFHDTRLSADNTMSCASCHPLDRYGMDGLARSRGAAGSTGDCNTPSVYNSAFNFRQFWDGRALTLEDQVSSTLHAQDEMASNWPAVLEKLGRDPALQELSRRAYGRGLDVDVIRSALAAFERSLTTPDAPFDRFLRGDEKALDAAAKRGWRRFQELGCIACHQGVNLGANMFATLGAMDAYYDGQPALPANPAPAQADKAEAEQKWLKVPGLRNVARTAPYFHEGQVGDLDSAVAIMAWRQLGLELGAEDRADIVVFLNSLTAPLPGGRK